jgi:hypothetical protein
MLSVYYTLFLLSEPRIFTRLQRQALLGRMGESSPAEREARGSFLEAD